MTICPHCHTVNHPQNANCTNCGAALVADPALGGDPFAGRLLGGRFQLESIVGSGEIGMVYRGSDKRSGQPVAVKLIHPDVAATHGDELLRSASMVAQLRHAKIATVLAAAREPDGTSYIVTEFLEGETLKSMIERTGPMGPRRSADIMFQLCSALAPIHRAGRPHANLKPENVFLLSRDGGDFVKIVDVGSPDLFGVRDTSAGKIIIGTPKYFSPEQAMGQRVGLSSDQFTIGIVGYQLLTGALPFFGATPDQLLAAIANGEPTPVSQRTAGVSLPDAMEAVINRCLHKDPKARYPDLRALATGLAKIIKSTQPLETVKPVERPKRPTFGAGVDTSTRVVDPGSTLEGLFDDMNAQEDGEATRIADLPPDLEAQMAAREHQVNKRLSQPPPPAPSDDMRKIPEPLMFTGSLASEDLQAALADAMVDSGGPRLKPQAPTPAPPPVVPAPKGPAAPSFGGNDLAAALADAVADVSPGEAPPPPASQPIRQAAESAPPGPKRKPSSGPQALSGEVADSILSAIHEELDGGASAGAASPLATAADFAALSPVAVEAARKRKTGPITVQTPAHSGGGAGKAVVAILLVAVAGGAGWYFTMGPGGSAGIAESPKTSKPTRAPKKAAVTAAKAPKIAGSIMLVSVPPAAQVRMGSKELGPTPIVIEVQSGDASSYDLLLADYEMGSVEVDPKDLVAGSVKEIKVELQPSNPKLAKRPDIPVPPRPGTDPEETSPKKPDEEPKAKPDLPKPKPKKRKPRKKKRKKKPKAKFIDPFAD